jgi:copper chaperone CopZ
MRQSAMASVAGVVSVSVTLSPNHATVVYVASHELSSSRIAHLISELGFSAVPLSDEAVSVPMPIRARSGHRRALLQVEGMHCKSCTGKIEVQNFSRRKHGLKIALISISR